MSFVWDRRKNRANLARHGITFEDAIRIFEGPTLEKVDDRFDYGETRVYAISVVRDHVNLHGCIRNRATDHFGLEGRTP